MRRFLLPHILLMSIDESPLEQVVGNACWKNVSLSSRLVFLRVDQFLAWFCNEIERFDERESCFFSRKTWFKPTDFQPSKESPLSFFLWSASRPASATSRHFNNTHCQSASEQEKKRSVVAIYMGQIRQARAQETIYFLFGVFASPAHSRTSGSRTVCPPLLWTKRLRFFVFVA